VHVFHGKQRLSDAPNPNSESHFPMTIQTSGSDSAPMTWPHGKRCAVCLTFDFDAESLWLAREPANADRLATHSQGRYGAKVGVPKILELLRQEDLKGTFFTPGWTVDAHPAKVEMILKDGHELGHHGYVHYWPDAEKPAQMLEEVDRGFDAMQRRFGVRPVGYRPPGSESCHYLLELLTRRGILYNSCFKDDIHPYRHVLRDGSPGPIELPEHPSLDDWGYGTSHLRFPRPIFGADHVLGIWQDEFRMIREWRGLYVLVMHPQVTGRPMRMAILRSFIAFTRQFDDVWYATGREIAEAFAKQEVR
jgi:peptidoglycan/xylan/chitin deacetylase (PgdA/CDA1 family)